MVNFVPLITKFIMQKSIRLVSGLYLKLSLLTVAVGLVLTGPEILASENGTGLVTADAMAKAMNSATMAKVIIIGGRCGIITSWNSFLMGGSRALYSMAESYMVPKVFAKLHPQYKTPVNALYLIGFLSILAPF